MLYSSDDVGFGEEEKVPESDEQDGQASGDASHSNNSEPLKKA